MPKGKLTMDEKREQARRVILDASLDLFITKGYEETTIRDIISKAGILNGSLYNRFKSKDEILFSLVREGVDDVLRSMKQIFDKENNLLLALSFPGMLQIYIASHSSRLAKMLYRANTMWSAVESYIEMNLDWFEKYFSGYGFKEIGNERVKLCIASLVGSVSNTMGYYANSGELDFRDAVRYHIRIVAACMNLPIVDMDSLINRLVEIVESNDFKFMGYVVSQELEQLSNS